MAPLHTRLAFLVLHAGVAVSSAPDAACAANPGCVAAGLTGNENCCPAANGMQLACCYAPAVSPAPPAPPVPAPAPAPTPPAPTPPAPPAPPAPDAPPLPDGVTIRVAKALGSKGYDKVRISLIRRDGADNLATVSGAVDWSHTSQFQHKWTGNHISSAVVSVTPGQTQTLNVDGHNVNIRIPRQNDGTVGMLVADPCIRQTEWCTFASTFDVKHTLHTVLDSLAAHGELDYWMNVGDLFYDQSGDISWEFFGGVSSRVASTVHGISMGNHDYWENGSPDSPRDSDNLGFGMMQFYAQDTLSSQSNDASPFDLSRTPPQIAHGSNFFWYNMMGNIAFISFSGADSWADMEDHFQEACSWADQENPSLVILMGHWDAGGYGCSSGMDAPAVFNELSSIPGCQRFASQQRIKFFEGHTHCNSVTIENTGFMVGAFGFSGCGDFGLPILDTRSERAVLYYFKLGEGGQRVSQWDAVMSCLQNNGLSGCTQYADKWMEQSLQSFEFAEQSESLEFVGANASRIELI